MTFGLPDVRLFATREWWGSVSKTRESADIYTNLGGRSETRASVRFRFTVAFHLSLCLFCTIRAGGQQHFAGWHGDGGQWRRRSRRQGHRRKYRQQRYL